MRLVLVCLMLTSMVALAVDRAKVVAYVEAERKAGRVPDIKAAFGTNLWGTDFSGLNLSGVDFSASVLSHCKFHKSDLRKAVFHHTELYLAEFHEADLGEADFTTCTLDRCILDKADLRKVIGLGHKVIMDVSAKGADFSGLNLSHSELNEIDFTDANLSNCLLTGADVYSSNFTRTTLTGVIADEVFFLNTVGLSQEQIVLLERSGAIASQKRMEELVRKGHSFKGKNIQRARLAGFDLRGADFRNAGLMHADFSGSNLQGARFTKAHLAWADFSQTNLHLGNFDHADCSGAKFYGADLRRASFRSTILEYAQFDDSQVDGADFAGAIVDQADFRRAIGNSVPSLEILNDRSGLAWQEFTLSLVKSLVTILPWLGLIALIVIITCAVKMSRTRGAVKWVEPTLGIYFCGLAVAVITTMVALSTTGGFIVLFAILCIGPLVSLFGVFIGIHHLAHGRKQRHWPSILFFTCAPIPHAGLFAWMYSVLLAMG